VESQPSGSQVSTVRGSLDPDFVPDFDDVDEVEAYLLFHGD
jgi:hypothetical protein